MTNAGTRYKYSVKVQIEILSVQMNLLVKVPVCHPKLESCRIKGKVYRLVTPALKTFNPLIPLSFHA